MYCASMKKIVKKQSADESVSLETAHKKISGEKGKLSKELL